MSLHTYSIKQLNTALTNKDISTLEMTEYFLDRSKKHKAINAFVELDAKQARSAANDAQKRIDEGVEASLLSGVPYATKDNIVVKGRKATGGSKILGDYKGSYNASIVRRMNRNGAINIGSTNLDEFGMGSSTENSAYKPTLNPFDNSKVAGGSSGGSAAAVSLGLVPFSFGTDTGGSVRQPASFCGIVGYKPTYGAIPRSGLMALGSSLDVVGTHTRTVEDAAIVAQKSVGPGRSDRTTVQLNRKISADHESEKTDLVVGIPKEFFRDGLDPEIEKVFESTVAQLINAGVKIKEISLPHISYGSAAYYVLVPAEASSNLARYDGVRYGGKNSALSKAKSLADAYVDTKSDGFGVETKRRIMMGAYSLSSGYYDAYYQKATDVRGLISQDFNAAFDDVDVILGPTTPSPAFKFNDKSNDPVEMYMSDVYTVGVNLAGVPAISLPMGSVDGLPVGAQLIAPEREDARLFELGFLIERLLGLDLHPEGF